MDRLKTQISTSFAWLLLGAGLCTSSGCGKGKATELPNTDPDYRYEIPTQNETEAQNLMALSRSSCADKSACPAAVGMLVVATPHALGMCTGFLTAPDTIMTNSHCIAEYLDRNARGCEGKIEVVFPETPFFPAERAQCAEITRFFKSDGNSDALSQDYAYIRLAAPLSRPVLALSPQGVSENHSLSVARMNPISTGSYAQGELQVIKCDPIFRTWFLPQSQQSETPLFVFAGCDVVGAHAGSPMLDENGRVRGIVQSRASRAPDDGPPGMIEKPENLGLATNLSCVISPNDAGRALPAACSEDFSFQRISTLRATLLNGVEEAADRAILESVEQWSKTNHLFFEWKVIRGTSPRPNAKAATVFPRCFHAEGQDGGWMKKYKGFFGSYKKQATVSIQLPAWDVQTGFNGRQLPAYKLWTIRSGFRVRPAEETDLVTTPVSVIDFNPNQLHYGGRSQVRIRISSFAPTVDQTVELPFCAGENP